MRISINLSREPFRRDRPILIASAATGVLLIGTLGLLIALSMSERTQAREAQKELNRVQRQLTTIRGEQAKLDAQIRLPENEVVLDRSILVNTIIRRKAISWTRIFEDLGTVLPHNVRIAVIRPQVNAKNQLLLDMTIEADAAEQLNQFVAKLEGSDIFGSTEVSAITPPTQNDPFFHYRISVNYAQKL
ncbi:MAG TPA: hypothetical protein VNH18_25900 [Bryobacteraceae bacterium]|nr:hypothetical protein [Bryobacteraceae bacterium]